MIAYSIEIAHQSGLFDHIVVSTDDEEIAAVARDYGAETPFIRPEKISDDFTGTNAVVKHAVRWFQNRNQSVTHACCIYATAPFLQVRYLREGYDKLINSNKQFAFSVTTFPFPIQRAIRINRQGEIAPFSPEHVNTRSQDLEEAYHDAAQFYWGRAEAFLEDAVTFSSASIPIVLPRYLVQDIDTEEDWINAEMMFNCLQETGRPY